MTAIGDTNPMDAEGVQKHDATSHLGNEQTTGKVTARRTQINDVAENTSPVHTNDISQQRKSQGDAPSLTQPDYVACDIPVAGPDIPSIGDTLVDPKQQYDVHLGLITTMIDDPETQQLMTDLLDYDTALDAEARTSQGAPSNGVPSKGSEETIAGASLDRSQMIDESIIADFFNNLGLLVKSKGVSEIPLPNSLEALDPATLGKLTTLHGFLKLISMIMLLCRRVINAALLATAKERQINTAERMNEAEEINKQTRELAKKMEKLRKKIAKAKKLRKTLGIITLVVSIVLTAAIVAATAGTGSVAAVAVAVAVNGALMAFVIADYTEDGKYTQEMSECIQNQWIKPWQKGMAEGMGGTKAADALAWTFTILIVLVIVVAAVAVTKGSTSRIVANTAMTEAGQAAVTVSLTMAMMQASMMFLTSSNVLMDGFKNIGTDSGMKKDDAEIFAIVMMVMILLGLAAAGGKTIGQDMGKMMEKAGPMIQKIAAYSEMTGMAAQGAINIPIGFQELDIARAVEEKADVEALLQFLREFVQKMLGLDAQSLEKAQVSLSSLSASIVANINSVFASAENVVATQFRG